MGDSNITGIDLGRESLKCVVLSVQKAGLKVEACHSVQLSVPAEADGAAWRSAAVEALKGWKSSGTVPPGRVVVTAPSAHTLIRALKVPTATFHQQLAEEAKQQLPFGLEELDWDYVVVGTEEEQSHVSLAAIKKDINAELLAMCAEAGFEPVAIESGALALGNVLLQAHGGSCSSPAAVLSIGATASNLTIADGTKVWMRTLPVTGSAIISGLSKNLNMTEADTRTAMFSKINLASPAENDSDAAKNVRATITRLIMEITRSLTFYKSQLNGEKPQKLYLAGGYSTINGLRAFLADRLKIEVEMFAPFAGVTGGTDTAPERYGEALGSALAGAGKVVYALNLLPKVVQAQRTLDRRKPFLVAAAFGLVAVVVLLYAFALRDRSTARSLRDAAQARMVAAQKFDKEIADVRKGIEGENARNESLRRALWDRDMCTYLLTRINQDLPSNCWISSIKTISFTMQFEEDKQRAATQGNSQPGGPTIVVTDPELLSRPVKIELHGGCYGAGVWAQLQPVLEAEIGKIPGIAKCTQKNLQAYKQYTVFDLQLDLDWDVNGVADYSDMTNAAVRGSLH